MYLLPVFIHHPRPLLWSAGVLPSRGGQGRDARAPVMGRIAGCGRDARAPRRCVSSNRSGVPGTFQNEEWRPGKNAPVDQDL